MQPRPQHGKGGRRPAPGAKPTPNPKTKRPSRAGPSFGPAGGGRPLRTEWSGEVAHWYDRLVGDEGSEYQRHVVHPGVLRLLALQPGESVVDVACGQGALARLLTGRGAEVTGVDAAPELIAAARERGPQSIRYHVADARELGFLPEAHFAAAACVLAIQNIHPIQPVFEGVRRALKPGGRFVLAMMHPAFRGPKETRWGWDDAAGVQFRRVDRYLLPRKSPIVTHPGKTPDVYTWTFHRPIGAYVKALRNAGLLVDALEEWPGHKTSEPGPRAAAENAARKEIPMFLAIRAVKVSGHPPTRDPAPPPPGPADPDPSPVE
jgi:ubiquinone/menaquinone biosynthesis C-methylase UbiE